MTLPTIAGAPRLGALFLMASLLGSPLASAQGVGAGPLTGSLTDTEPMVGVLEFANIKFAPGLIIREMGWDDNVFDEAVDQKEDYVVSVMPDVSAFTLTRFAQFSAYVGSDLNYYRTYSQENSTGHAVRGRVDLLFSRVKPFIAGGQTVARTRPNGEIDVRADRAETELSGGLAFVMSDYSSIYGAVNIHEQGFRDAFEEGVDLAEALNRKTTNYSAGLRTALTPLLTMTLSGTYGEDVFDAAPLRDSYSYSANAAFRFGAEAVVSGFLNVGYREFKPVDPLVEHSRSVMGQMGLSYSLMEVGRINVSGSRSLDYSFDESEGYFIENSLNLGYTHRLVGPVDSQVRGSWSWFDYGHRVDVPPRIDTLETAGASVGYNLPNRTRISINYEYSRRRSPAFPERNYQRRRAYLSWAYAF